MLDTLKPGEERLVPYAVELGVKVLDNVDSHQDRVQRVVVREGWLSLFTLHVEKTTYTFTSHADAEQTLYLDHPRPNAEWTLHDTPEPREVTENYWRFRFALPAKKTTAFAVTQRYLVQQQENLHHLNAGKLGLWLEQRYLDRGTEEALRQVLALQLRAGELEQRRTALQEEREAIHQEQQRLRENLQALGDRATEKELRERIVRTLNGQEDRLEQIAAESKSCTTEREQVTAQVRTLLGALEYEAGVQA
jgi:hypothetical protein